MTESMVKTHEEVVLDTLKVGRARIASGWTQNACVRKPNGARWLFHDLSGQEPPPDLTGCTFCLVGSTSFLPFWEEADDILHDAAEAAGYPSAAAFNDVPGRTHEEVLAFYDRVIANEEEKIRAAQVNPRVG